MKKDNMDVCQENAVKADHEDGYRTPVTGVMLG